MTKSASRSVLLIIIAGTLILAVNMGVRQAMGLLIPNMAMELGWSMANLSFAFAVQNLVWGGFAPIAGLLAERYGTVKVLWLGAIIYALGLAGTAVTQSPWLYHASNGLLIGIGTGATTYPIVLAAVGKRVSEAKRSLLLGVVSAGGSFGQFAFALITEWSNTHYGWRLSIWLMATAIALIVLAAPALRNHATSEVTASKASINAASNAYRDQRLWLLAIGFFVCGFHVAFITVHLPNLVALCGLAPAVAASSLALIGLVNVIGTIGAGWLGGRFHKPYLLSGIYGARALLIIVFLFAPKTEVVFYSFSAIMGMLWLSTVPLTSGAVAQYFGTQKLASLFGLVMFSHQIGAFVGALLAGWIYDLTQSYDIAWMISAALGLLAAAIHLPLRPGVPAASTPS